MKKRVIALISAVVLCLSLFVLSVSAASLPDYYRGDPVGELIFRNGEDVILNVEGFFYDSENPTFYSYCGYIFRAVLQDDGFAGPPAEMIVQMPVLLDDTSDPSTEVVRVICTYLGEGMFRLRFRLDIDGTYIDPASPYIMSHLFYDVTKFYTMIYDAGYETGYDVGVDATVSLDYDDGYNAGYEEGYGVGHDEGYEEGEVAGFSTGYEGGYEEGVLYGEAKGSTTWIGLFSAPMDAMSNTLYSLFNFEIFGFDMRLAIGSLLVLCVVIIVFKKVL